MNYNPRSQAKARATVTYYQRNLPHWHPSAKDLFVTWRLYGSLPHNLIAALKARKWFSHGRHFREFDASLDSLKFGPAWLKQAPIASLVVAKMKHVQQLGMCQIHAYVVMPNHVHALVEPAGPLEKITRSIKGPTAREANLMLGRTGDQFWQTESFDHWVRNSAEFERIRSYIEANPVSAGLASTPSDWPWSSAAQVPVA